MGRRVALFSSDSQPATWPPIFLDDMYGVKYLWGSKLFAVKSFTHNTFWGQITRGQNILRSNFCQVIILGGQIQLNIFWGSTDFKSHFSKAQVITYSIWMQLARPPKWNLIFSCFNENMLNFPRIDQEIDVLIDICVTGNFGYLCRIGNMLNREF